MTTKTPHPVDKHVGSRVRTRRLMLGMSQGKLAAQLGVTFQQVQKYERGTDRISASRLLAMSQALQVPVPFFFEGIPHVTGSATSAGAPSPAYLSDFLTSPDGLKLARAFIRIGDARLARRFVRLVEELADASAA